MRVLAVMHVAEPAGPPQHVRPWLAALAETGSLEVVAPERGPVLDLYAGLGATTELRYEAAVFPRGVVGALRLAGCLATESVRFYRLFRRRAPDVAVIVTTVVPSALIAARLARVPTVLYATEIFDNGLGARRGRRLVGSALARMTEELSDRVVACSRAVAAQFRGQATTRTIYPGVDPDALAGDREAFRERHGIDDASPCLAVLGNITRGRGQDLVIAALPALRRTFPGVHLLIAGTPFRRPADLAYRRELDRLVAELNLGDAVTFPGHVDRVGDVYAAADIVVNPARVSEAFGRVAVEALAAGRPVIATRVGAVPEVLSDGRDALLVAPDSPPAIVRAVERLWGDRALVDRLVTSGRERVRADFSESTSVDEFRAVVAGLLVSRRMRSGPVPFRG